MAKNVQKRLRHLRGVWERRMRQKEYMKIVKAKNLMSAVADLSIRARAVLRAIAYKVTVRSRKYRIPKCYRRNEHPKLNG